MFSRSISQLVVGACALAVGSAMAESAGQLAGRYEGTAAITSSSGPEPRVNEVDFSDVVVRVRADGKVRGHAVETRPVFDASGRVVSSEVLGAVRVSGRVTDVKRGSGRTVADAVLKFGNRFALRGKFRAVSSPGAGVFRSREGTGSFFGKAVLVRSVR